MRSDFVEPRYEDLALVNLLPSVMATLDGGVPTIPLPRASKYVVLLVDGLGWHQLLEHADHAETMAAMSRGSTRITCSVPSTTATSLTSLGCGVPTGSRCRISGRFSGTTGAAPPKRQQRPGCSGRCEPPFPPVLG